MAKKNVRPFMEGVFSERDGEFYLVGAKCRSCGQVFFPKRKDCINCFSGSCDELLLSRNGKLYSYTISYMPVYHFDPPHTIGYVELPEGVRVFSPLGDLAGKHLKVGMDMELKVEKLWGEGENEVIGYKFRPV